MSVIYSSGVYVFGTSKINATLTEYNGFDNHMLPKKISIRVLASLLSRMQEICFNDTAIEINTQRLINMFTSGGKDKTVALVLSLGYLDVATDITDFVDGGSATIQMSNQGLFEIQQPWINEVCRAKMIDDHSHFLKPIKNVMELIDNHILTHLSSTRKGIDGAYLYVEKSPEHGSASVLLDYYHKNYGYNELFADDEFYYMKKPYIKTPPSPMRKTTLRSTRKKTPSPIRKTTLHSTRKK